MTLTTEHGHSYTLDRMAVSELQAAKNAKDANNMLKYDSKR